MAATRTSSIGAVLAVSVLTTTGCSTGTPGPETIAPPRAEADCGAGQLGAYIGRPASEQVLVLIRHWRGDKPIRVLQPGSATTMDYRPERLNIFVDENDRIKEFTCN